MQPEPYLSKCMPGHMRSCSILIFCVQLRKASLLQLHHEIMLSQCCLNERRKVPMPRAHLQFEWRSSVSHPGRTVKMINQILAKAAASCSPYHAK